VPTKTAIEEYDPNAMLAKILDYLDENGITV
jgi:hypothetical protein